MPVYFNPHILTELVGHEQIYGLSHLNHAYNLDASDLWDPVVNTCSHTFLSFSRCSSRTTRIHTTLAKVLDLSKNLL